MAPKPLPWPASAARDRLRTIAATVGETRDAVINSHADLRHQFDRLERMISTAAQTPSPSPPPVVDVERLVEGLRVAADHEPAARAALWALRAAESYEAAFEEDEPLVSVIIPAGERTDALRERALPSVLAQTYPRLEVLVVAEGPGDAARRTAEDAGDDRVTFRRLPLPAPYPADPELRRLVAGAGPYNEAARLATGRWIAPLDEGDALHADHVEGLLARARAERAELAYGRFREYGPGGAVRANAGGFPPPPGDFRLGTALYHAGLAGIFELELADAVWGVPADWGIFERMRRAGVRMALLDQEVVHHHPAGADGAAPPQERPQWEVAPEGVERARAQEQVDGTGWDVEAVARAYERKWPEFVAAVEGSGPLGVPHEVPDGVAMPREDQIAQTTALAYGNVLARATRSRDSLSVLDWGGALGHYLVLARALVDDVHFDYHVKELPAVCATGRRLMPEVSFHDDDGWTERRYDLVMSSGALHYADDWRETVAQLAGRADGWLYLARVPVARRTETFAMRQRAYDFGYETEYVGWVLNRDELVDAVRELGFEQAREYVLQPPMPVHGAPEDPVHLSLAFRRSDPA
jgi:putative methyltransferase (TIGR04325 family)